MPDLKMDCFGSVILFDRTARYCGQCPLANTCEVAVTKNKALIENMLDRPVFAADGRYWKEKAVKIAKPKATVSPKLKAVTINEPKPPSSFALQLPKTIEAVATATAHLPRIVRAYLTPAEVVASSMPIKIKVREQIERWCANGVEPVSVTHGVNPFDGRSGFKIASAITAARLHATETPTKKDLVALSKATLEASSGRPWVDSSIQSNVNIVSDAYAACGIPLYK